MYQLYYPPQKGYDQGNWRDSFVLWDDEKQEYLLIPGTRKDRDKRKQTGQQKFMFVGRNLRIA